MSTRLGNSILTAMLAFAAAGCGGPVYDSGAGSHGPSTSSGTVTPPSSVPPSSTPPSSATYTITLYWNFARHVRGQSQSVIYDPQPGPGGTSSGACGQSGVDTVVVSDASGAPLDGTGSGVPCVYQGVQGVTFPGFAPGTHDLLVTGFRAGHALYETPIQVDVTAGGSNAFDVTVPGIPDDLDILALFLNSSGVETWTSCANATVDTLEYQLIDSAGTTVASGSTACADPAGLSFQAALSDGIDRDAYTISMRALDLGGVAFQATPPGCAAQVFDHLGADSLAHGWNVGLYVTGTVCR